MAGKKGMVGGGGAREGAGRKPKALQLLSMPLFEDPLEFLLSVMNSPDVDAGLRVRAGIAAAQYKNVKRADGGKKDERQQRAKTVGQGKFASAAPPKLVVNNRFEV